MTTCRAHALCFMLLCRHIIVGGSDGTFQVYKGYDDDEPASVDVEHGSITTLAAKVCIDPLIGTFVLSSHPRQ